ncbi:MAG: hypothetical protein JW951_09290 [Lentisphaerae bacterium]|nr:hypothetical protein [Lentisphaerota bacterium]
MTRAKTGSRAGFTLVEISIATAVLVLALAMTMGGMAYALRSSRQADAQNELDIDLQVAMERIKYDLRLSSLNEMFFYPAGAGPYEAISFPMARDDDGDGAIDLDGAGNIIWDRTMVYHVWSSVPNQLRLTVFDPRDNTLSDAERQEQINSVVTTGNGESTHNAAHADTLVVFENLVDLEITPEGSTFDGYGSELQRELNVTLGSILLDGGSHTFTFTVEGQNPSSSGYKAGVDSLYMSPSYSIREGEAQLPATAYTGPLPVRQYMAGGSWGGNFQLLFNAWEEGQSFTLTLDNDCWEETNFRAGGDLYEDTTVAFDTMLNPDDYVVMLQGLGYGWNAYEQTGDTNGVAGGGDAFTNCAIRVLVRGEEMLYGNWIEYNGSRCWVKLKGGGGSGAGLDVEAVYIAECSDTENADMDAVPGTGMQLMFGASEGCSLDSGVEAFTSLGSFGIEKRKSYLVTLLVAGTPGRGNPWRWDERQPSTARGCYIIPASSNPQKADAAAATWSTRGDVMGSNCVLGVTAIYMTYPQRGTYTSQIFDTHLAAPNYTTIDWDDTVPSGGALYMKVRTGTSNDLSDAAAWTNIAAMVSPGSINPGDQRYVQFQAELHAGSYDLSTPKLEDVTIAWDGEPRVVEVGGTFTRGPDYGIFSLDVDGRELKAGVNVAMTIYKDVLGLGGTHRITSSMRSEVRPRNNER